MCSTSSLIVIVVALVGQKVSLILVAAQHVGRPMFLCIHQHSAYTSDQPIARSSQHSNISTPVHTLPSIDGMPISRRHRPVKHLPRLPQQIQKPSVPNSPRHASYLTPPPILNQHVHKHIRHPHNCITQARAIQNLPVHTRKSHSTNEEGILRHSILSHARHRCAAAIPTACA